MKNWVNTFLSKSYPYQDCLPQGVYPNDIVQVQNKMTGYKSINIAKNLWWGWVDWNDIEFESVITHHRVLSRPKGSPR